MVIGVDCCCDCNKFKERECKSVIKSGFDLNKDS